MSSIRQILPNYTTSDYERWEGKWEIITGVPYSMAPMTNPVHQNISSNLSWLLEQAIVKNVAFINLLTIKLTKPLF